MTANNNHSEREIGRMIAFLTLGSAIIMRVSEAQNDLLAPGRCRRTTALSPVPTFSIGNVDRPQRTATPPCRSYL
jgi:hypothetical protein